MPPGRLHVHQHDVGLELRRHPDRVLPVAGLAHDLKLRVLLQNRAHAGAHQIVVVDDHDADHWRGISTTTCVPMPASLSNRIVPLTSAARSRMPVMPAPSDFALRIEPLPVVFHRQNQLAVALVQLDRHVLGVGVPQDVRHELLVDPEDDRLDFRP